MSDALSWTDVAEHLTGFAYVSTVTSDGMPHVSVVAPTVDDDTIWIGTGRTSNKARNLAANPRIAIVWVTSAEVYVWGDVELVDDVPTKERLWNGWGYDPAMFFRTADNPDYVLARVTPRRATVLTQDESGLTSRRWRA